MERGRFSVLSVKQLFESLQCQFNIFRDLSPLSQCWKSLPQIKGGNIPLLDFGMFGTLTNYEVFILAPREELANWVGRNDNRCLENCAVRYIV